MGSDAAALLLQHQRHATSSPGAASAASGVLSGREDSVSIDSALQRLAEATVSENEDAMGAPGVAESLQRLTRDLGEENDGMFSWEKSALKCIFGEMPYMEDIGKE